MMWLSFSQMVLPAFALGLAVTLAYQLAAPMPEYEPSPVKGRRAVPVISLPEPFVPPPLGDFTEIAERPLFASTRKPFKEAAAAPVAEAPPQPRMPPNLTLIGIIVDGKRRIAIAKSGARSISLTPGATIEGWSVVAIEADRIALKSDDETREIRLPRPVPSTPAQPRPGTPPQQPQPPRTSLPPGYAPAQPPQRP